VAGQINAALVFVLLFKVLFIGYLNGVRGEHN